MPIQLIENFELSVPKPIDNRIVVGPGFTYTDKNSIPLPYVGMRIFDTNDSYPYLWTGSTWSFETNRVNVTHNITSNSDHFINFVSATGSPQLLQTNQTLRFNPLRGQITSGPGVARYPTYGFTSSNSSTFMGMWKVSSNTIGFSISRTSGTDFQISQTGITASQKFSVANNIPNAFTFGEGTARFGRLSGVFPSIEFYATSPNTALRVYNLSPVNIEGTRPGGLPGYSNATPETTGLSLENWTNNSVFNVRDQHYINTESRKGILSIGNAGNNDQFLFFMRDHTNTSSSGLFGLNGGGLAIQNNLSVGGVAKASYMLAEGSSPGDYLGLGIRNADNSNSSSKASALSFWGKSFNSPGNIDQRVVDIVALARGVPADRANWIKSSLVFQVIPRNLTGGLINYSGVAGWNAHTIEIREDGQVYMGPNQGAGAGLSGLPSGAGASTIFAGSPFFPTALPKLEVLAGLSEDAYSQCIVLRHNTGALPVTRRLGMLMKMSNEGDLNESGKMGGLMVESIEGYSNYPSLFLMTTNVKRIQIDTFGNIGLGNFTSATNWNKDNGFDNSILYIHQSDILARIHNRGTGNIGDFASTATPWNYPALASGTYVPVVNSNTNCNTFNTYNAAWMRVGNVVSVSGRIRLTVVTVNIATEFRLSLPINSNFGVDSNTPGSNDWQLNGVGKLVSIFANAGGGTFNYDSGNVASIEARAGSGGGNDALFRFKSSYTGTCYLTYNFQYILGSWPDTIVTVPID